MKQFVVIFMVILTGCDYSNPVDYNVSNQSTETLKVYFKTWDSDSIRVVEPNQEITLFVREIIGSSVWNPEFGNDTIWAIQKINVFKNDSISINRNFRQIEFWKYKEFSRHHAELKLVLTDDNINSTIR